MFSCLCSEVTFSHSLTLTLFHSLTLDMLNNFCFHVHSQKSLYHSPHAEHLSSSCLCHIDTSFRIGPCGIPHDMLRKSHDMLRNSHDVLRKCPDRAELPHDVLRKGTDRAEFPHNILRNAHSMMWTRSRTICCGNAHDMLRKCAR